jgi:hypothetical protein
MSLLYLPFINPFGRVLGPIFFDSNRKDGKKNNVPKGERRIIVNGSITYYYGIRSQKY